MTNQVAQVVGSLLILSAYLLSETGRMKPSATVYLIINLLGSSTLAGCAVASRQWGFLLLEGIWALVSSLSLAVRLRRHPRA